MKWLKSFPFWVSVVFAAIIWFFLYLSNNVDLNINCPIEYRGLSYNYALSYSSDERVPIVFSVQGSKVNYVKNNLNKFKIVVDVKLLGIKFDNDIVSTVYSVSDIAKEQINKKLNHSNENFVIEIDSVKVIFEKTLLKKVPVNCDFYYEISDNSMLGENSGLSVDSVTVFGLSNDVGKVNYVYMGEKNLGKIFSTKEITVYLSDLYPKLRFYPEAVTYTIDVQLATQNKISFSLSEITNGRYYFYPDSVNILYKVALGDYDNIKKSDFYLRVDYEANNAFIYLDKHPDNLIILEMAPDFVEYYSIVE